VKNYHLKIIILVVSYCYIIIYLAFIVMNVGKNTSHHHQPEFQSTPTPGLDYGVEWITELKNLSVATGITPEDILYMRWNSRHTSMDFNDRSELAMFVQEIPVEGIDLLTESQLGLLHIAVTEWLFCNGNNDRESYYRYLFESKETLDEDGQEEIRKLALDKNRLDVLEMNSLQQLVWFYSEKKTNIHWQGLVAEGTRIKAFETETANFLYPGDAIQSINRKIVGYFRKTTPPISFEDELKNRASVLVADLEVYVASDEGNIKPYFCRYWFDTENNNWRLKDVVYYPKQDDLDMTAIVS